MGDHRACGDDRTTPDSHAGENRGVGRDPAVVLDDDRGQRGSHEIGVADVMLLRQEEAESRKVHVVTDMHPATRQKDVLRPDDAIVADRHIVGIVEHVAGPDHRVAPDSHADGPAIDGHAERVGKEYMLVEPDQVQADPITELLAQRA